MVPRIGFEPMYVRLEGVCRSPLGDRGIKLRVRICTLHNQYYFIYGLNPGFTGPWLRFLLGILSIRQLVLPLSVYLFRHRN